jgi:hypothetical protein
MLEILVQARQVERKDFVTADDNQELGRKPPPGYVNPKKVMEYNEYQKKVKRAEDRLRVWLLVNGFEIDPSRVFNPIFDNMYPIKFLSDLVHNKMGRLMENPFDTQVHPDLQHDYDALDISEMKKNMEAKNASKVHANVANKIVDTI